MSATRRVVPISTRVDLDALDTQQLLDLFSTLECPAIEEMSGDYYARMLRQPTWLLTAAGTTALANPMTRWLSKGFRPVGPEHGRGYNSFNVLGRTIQLFPMHTEIAASRFDGMPAYQLVYSAYRSLCGAMNMVDEIRRVDDTRYLGIGTWGFTTAARHVPQPFVLEGPNGRYLGDIGKPTSRQTETMSTRCSMPARSAALRV